MGIPYGHTTKRKSTIRGKLIVLHETVGLVEAWGGIVRRRSLVQNKKHVCGTRLRRGAAFRSRAKLEFLERLKGTRSWGAFGTAVSTPAEALGKVTST